MATQVSDILTVEKVRKLCSDFLGNEWEKNFESIEVRRFLSGATNRTFQCTLNGKNVIVKLYGGETMERIFEENEDAKKFAKNSDESACAGEAAEAVLVNILSLKNLAPKLLGVFNGGRIEEYISGRNLMISDFEDKQLYSIVARKLAKYHSTAAPFRRKLKWLELYSGVVKFFTKGTPDYEKIGEEHKDAVRRLLDFSVIDEMQWVSQVAVKFKLPIVFSHNDLHFNNIILTENFESLEDKLMFVDYELSGYNYRGFDIAYFLNAFEFNIFAGLEKSTFNYTAKKCDANMKEFFMREYLHEINKIEHNNEIDEKNSLEFLSMEVELFTLQAYLVFICYSTVVVFDPSKDKPIDHISALLSCYEKQKLFFTSKYECHK